MFQVIKGFCDSERMNGLLLLDAPTGSGKTYQVCKYIHEAVKRDKEASVNRKYFFITTLKKNLPDTGELRRVFREAGDGKLFSEAVLRVDSNTDSVRGFLRSKDTPPVPSEVKGTPQWEQLNRQAGSLSWVEKQSKAEIDMLKQAKDAFSKAERSFRKMITGRLQAAFKTADERLEALRRDKNWQWLGKMYPVALLQDRRVICMSVDKFFLPLDTITEGSILLYNSQVIEGNTVFIDEVDATKETLLKRIINSTLEKSIDEIDLFSTINSSLQTKQFSALLTAPPSKRAAKGSLDYVIEKNKQKACQVSQKYSLEFNFKTQQQEQSSGKNFLFQDYRYISISGNNSFVYAKPDKAQKINSIVFQSKRQKGANEDNSEQAHYGIPAMLGEVRGFISHFCNGVRLLAENYKEHREESGAQEVFPLEQAVSTVLHEFTSNEDQLKYLTWRVLSETHKADVKDQESAFDLSFWERCFRYYAFEDSLSHDTQSKIMMSSFDTTPEKLLLALCRRAKVLGISATASIPSKIGNYDIEYLERRLQDDFVRLTDEQKQRIEKDFDEANNYEGVKVNVELIGEDGGYNEDVWRKVFADAGRARRAFALIESALSEDKDDYNARRYFRIAVAFKRFLENTDIRSFLCVLTKHPKEGDPVLDWSILQKIFSWIKENLLCDFNVSANVIRLISDDYEVVKKSICDKLLAGERVFVVSAYQTIGAGQNLQYTIPQDLKDKLVITGRESGQKDFDAIYLDKPTNLLVNLSNGLSPVDLAKYLFQVESLQEGFEISVDDTKTLIKNAFDCYARRKRTKYKNLRHLYDCASVKWYATTKIIQAIGRICRTGNKQSNVWVFADREIASYIHPHVTRIGVYNKEFHELLKACAKLLKEPEQSSLEIKANTVSNRAKQHIDKLLGGFRSGKSIDEWKMLRKTVLTSPVMSKDEAKKSTIAYNFYVELPSLDTPLYYREEGDFEDVKVSFKEFEGAQQVCPRAARLDTLMSYPDLCQWFKAQGFATTFGSGEMVMSPPLFNNIYKGALGEVCGKWFFDRLPDVKLEEITDEAAFEVFDFKVAGKAVYVDFKNWCAATEFDETWELEKIQDKARRIGASGVVVANVFHPDGKELKILKPQHDDDIKVLRIPALLAGEGEVRLVDDAVGAIKDFIGEFSKEESDECIE